MTDASFQYLYCVSGPEVAADLADLEGMEPEGAPRLIEDDGLVAVASTVPAQTYREDALQRHLDDPDWLAERGLRHARVVETCFRSAGVLPMRFATIFHSPERVRSFLRLHRPRLQSQLDRLSGKAEWVVSLHIDREVFARRLAESLRRGAMKEQASAPGRAYLEAKLAAVRARASEEEAMTRCLDDFHTRLRGATLDDLRGPPRQQDLLVSQAAYLVALDQGEPFRTLVQQQADAAADQGLGVRVTGPWPPYSFVGPLEDEA